MNNTKVSVIIPAYNAEKYIKDAMESVLAQTYPAHEIIVVDDGSTDHTAKIVKEYVDIKYIYQMNKGPGAARNRGIKEAKGEYIAFLDSDDMWMPEKLEKQIAKFKENHSYSLVHTNRIRIEADGSIKLSRNSFVPEGQVFNELLKRSFIYCSSVMVKRSCFDDIGLFDENTSNRSEDYDMWLRIANKYEFGFLQAPLIKYRVNPDGYNRSNVKITYDSEKYVFLKALGFYKGDKVKVKNRKLNNLMYRMGRSFYYAKDYRQAAKSFFEALMYKKTDLKSMSFYLASTIKKL